MIVFLLLNLIIFANCYENRNQQLNVLVDEITTTTVVVTWNSTQGEVQFICKMIKENESMEMIKTALMEMNETADFSNNAVVLDGKKQEIFMKAGMTRSNLINITGLKSGTRYILMVNDSQSTWFNTFKTATCPNNWEGWRSGCYQIPNLIQTWKLASKTCSSFGTAHLAYPRSLDGIQFIREFIAELHKRDENPPFYWIGVHDRDVNNDFTYSDDSPVSESTVSFWRKCAEKRHNGSNCISLVSQENNYTQSCLIYHCSYIPAGFICQYPVSDSPHSVGVVTGTDYATVTWNKPQSVFGSSFEYFEITLHLLETGQNTSRIVDEGQNSTTFTNLNPGVHYAVQIRTIHNISEGNVAKGPLYPMVNFITQPSPPRNLVVSDVSPTTAEMSWFHPDNSKNSHFHGFIIRYSPLYNQSNISLNFSNQAELYVSSNTSMTELTQLEPAVQFQTMVASYVEYFVENRGKIRTESEPTESAIFETLVSPPLSFYVQSIGTNFIKMEWITALGDIDGYVVGIKLDEIDQKVITENYSKNATSALQNGLKPGAPYVISIMTIQGVKKSKELQIHQRTRPLPVQSIQVKTEVMSTSVEFLIYKLLVEENVFDGFNVTMISQGPVEKIDFRIEANKSGSWDLTEVTGLTPGRSYLTTIWVTSGSVLSTPTDLDILITPLEPPTNLRAPLPDERSLRLKWDASPGDFEEYVVECEPGEPGYNCSMRYVDVPRGKEECFITGLLPGALYNFSVIAQQTSIRSSPATLSVRTLPDPPTDVQLTGRNTTFVGLRWRPAEYFQDKYRVEFTPTTENGFFSGSPPVNGAIEFLWNVHGSNHVNREIKELLPGTSYKFSIRTGSDMTWSKPTTVMSVTVPEAVESLQADEVGATWVMLSWTQGSGVANYFQLSHDGKDLNIPANEEYPKYNYTLLSPSTYENIVVTTVSNGDESKPITINILTRPLPPSDVIIKNIQETSFIVIWKSPENSSFDRFILESDALEELVVLDRNERQFNMTGLIAGKKYFVHLKSLFVNSESFPVIKNITTYPFPPTNLIASNVSTNEIKLLWKLPKGENETFLVEWDPKHGKVNAYQGEALINGLTPGVNYSISVSTYSEDERQVSKLSALLTVYTFESAPGSPNNLIIDSVSTSSFVVAWDHPIDPNGKILMYKLRYQRLFPRPNVNYGIINITGDGNIGEINHLEAGAGYIVSVAAVNSAGEGNYSKTKLIKTEEGKAGIVDNLRAFPLSSSSVQITWNPPSSPNGFIDNYRVSLLDLEGSKVKEVELSNSLKWPGCLFEDLSNETLLSFLPFENSSVIIEIGFGTDVEYDNLDETRERNLTLTSLESELNEDKFDPYCLVFFTFFDLPPYTTYNVEVEARTKIGVGPIANTTVITRQEPPEGPPTNIRVLSYHSESLTLRWNPPVRPNGFLTYTVEFFDGLNESRLFRTNFTEVAVSDLRPFTWYGATVFGESEAGVGPVSELLTFHTAEGAPEEVEIKQLLVISSRSINVKWISPKKPHGIVTGYVIEIIDIARNNRTTLKQKVEANFNVDEANFDQASPKIKLGSLIEEPVLKNFEATLSDLKPYTQYYIGIAAETAAGIGAFTRDNIQTSEDKPGSPPVDIRYTNISSTSVNITWLEPIDPNGEITKYTVGISDRGIIKHNTKKRFIVLDRLRKYHEYELYLWAWTGIGEGPSSNKVLIHTDEDVPGSPPLNVSYRNISSSAVEVWWNPSLIPNGLITHYNVYYKIENKTLQKESDTNSVILEKLQPYGVYKLNVTASTRIGEGPSSKPILVRTMEGQPATPPYNLSYTNITSDTVLLEWLPPTSPNGVIQFYDVNITTETTEDHYMLFRTYNQTPSLKITSLQPFTHYKAVVLSNTKYGDGGQESAPLNIWTMESVPESPPQNVQYINLTSSSVKVTWSPPANPNGIIVNYTLRYKRFHSNDINELVVAGKNDDVEIEGLEKYTKYTLAISANTIAGKGPSWNITIITDEDAPSSPPYDFIYTQSSSTSIVLSWKPPILPNGVILGYRVFYSNKTHSFHNETKVANFTLDGLRKYGQYTAYVTAFTKFGDGSQRSNRIEFRTLEDAPSDPPSNVVLVAASSTSVNASWTPPKHPNGNIQFYTIFYTTGSSKEESMKVFSGTSTTIENLQKYTWYSIWLTASTAKGDGNHTSEKVEVRTLPGVPDFPVYGLIAEANSPYSISINWKPFMPLTGPTYYIVKVKMHNPELNQNNGIVIEQLTTNKTSISVSALKPFTQYMIDVTPKVVNVDKNGPSKHIVVTTKEDKPNSTVLEFKYFDLTSTTVKLNWSEPISSNGVILSYDIILSSIQEARNLSVLSTSTIIKNLKPFTSYIIEITSRNQVGIGPFTDLTFQTKEDVPEDSPYNVQIHDITKSSVTATWEAPKIPNGVIRNYTLHYWTDSISKKDDYNLLTAKITSQTITDLRPFTRYYITVAALTAVGPGPASRPKEITTLESTPDIPTGLSCTAESEDEVAIQWQMPDPTNGLIVGYTLSYYLNSSDIIMSLNFSSSKLNYVIDGLMAFTEYVVTVKASTGVGSGDAALCVVRTKQGYPGPPKIISEQKVNESSITLTWMPPPETNGILESYNLTYQPDHSCLLNEGSVILDKKTEMKKCKIDAGLNSSWQLHNLQKYTVYTLTVQAKTGKGFGLASPPKFVRTEEGSPDYPPTSVQAKAVSSSQVNVFWERPIVLAGKTTYKVKGKNVFTNQTTSSNTLDIQTRNYQIRNLNPSTKYEIIVEAITSKGSLGTNGIFVTTKEDVPSDPPRNLSLVVIKDNSSSAILLFRPPLTPNGNITMFHAQYRMKSINSTINITIHLASLSQIGGVTNYSWPIHGLLGGREYAFRMKASTAIGLGPWSEWSAYAVIPNTAPPRPSPPILIVDEEPGRSAEDWITPYSITLSSPCVFSSINGQLSQISVIIAEEGGMLEEEPTTWKKAYPLSPSPPYKVIASNNPTRDCPLLNQRLFRKNFRRKRSAVPKEQGFVVGTDDTCSDSPDEVYCNGPLKSDTSYRFKFRAVTENGLYTDTEYSTPIRTKKAVFAEYLNVIIGSAAGGIALILVIIIIIVVIKKRRMTSFDKSQESDNMKTTSSPKRIISDRVDGKGPIVESGAHTNKGFTYNLADNNKVSETKISRPIPTAEFGSHVARLCLNHNRGFIDEYNDMCALPVGGRTTIAEKMCNKNKNRHPMIIPFDENRVKLDEISLSDGSYYINASYVTGEAGDHQYIATQCPLKHTREDFWRMIWEEGSSAIVMLDKKDTNKDDNNCYWQSNEAEQYGTVIVRPVSEENHSDWILRKITLEKGTKSRTIMLFDINKWPKPESASGAKMLLRFIHEIQECVNGSACPLVVMSGDGSERCGVFVSVDRILDQLRLGSQVDIYGTVASVRSCRINLVQNANEYILIYRCIFEAINHKLTGTTPTGDGLEETVF